MNKQIELWRFVHDRLSTGQPVMLLVVAESHGSSPGRQGYKMAVATDGNLAGSIGGGVMEVKLVEHGRKVLEHVTGGPAAPNPRPFIVDQVHRKNSSDASGMICSGRQSVIFKLLEPRDEAEVERAINALTRKADACLKLGPDTFEITPHEAAQDNEPPLPFQRTTGHDFTFVEQLGIKDQLIIIGGGHCALALSEVMSRMDFHIRIFDDRPELNTLDKNNFADEITIIDDYGRIGDHVVGGDRVYVAVMTLGYASDAIVIRQLIDKPLKYLGVLGSKAKMATLLKKLTDDGYPKDLIEAIRTPIGVPIHSRTPEEIAISIAAEIISVKNSS